MFFLPLQLFSEQFTTFPALHVLNERHRHVFKINLTFLSYSYINFLTVRYQLLQSVGTTSPGWNCRPPTLQRQSDSCTHTPSWGLGER